jgi:methylenetetrahydrofolate dehydrogenase (NADP+)/methenyltetrahydrofolate cyclohydrolase
VEHIAPEKDVDGLTTKNLGALFAGTQNIAPCTATGIMDLLGYYKIELDGKHAVVVGRITLVGKSVAELLEQQNATVTLCHSHTKNLTEITRQADILVAATGQAHLITGDMVKPGAVVIDAGIARVNGKLTGDIEPESVKEVAGFLSPVPGGAGPMTISALLSNTIDAAERLAHGTA